MTSFEMTNEFEKIDDVTSIQDEDDDEEEEEGLGIDSIEPLTSSKHQRRHRQKSGENGGKNEIEEKDKFKDYLSFALSVFNLMNAILGSGILGLAEALKNLGIIPFLLLLMLTASLASYTINMLLHMSQLMGMKSYESLSHRSFGYIGKITTTIIIILHCLGAMCSYVYIIKEELPEFIRALLGDEVGHDEWYLSGKFLMLGVVILVIMPLASMKDIKILGYSSAFGMTCMLLFTFTVVGKKFSIPCPLDEHVGGDNMTSLNMTSHHQEEEEEEQYCEAKMFVLNSRSAYAVPTMFFSFMCHASMLPIYAELRRPSIRKMQNVANVSIMMVFCLYTLAAVFGYLTFFNRVESELLLTYSKFDSHDPLILVSRFMVIICVTLSVPLLHYPARKTIVLTFCKSPQEFRWFRHITIMLGFISITVLLVLFIPNIRDIFGFAGATTSATLLVILPSLFVIRLTGSQATPSVRKTFFKRRLFAWFLMIFGTCFMLLSTAMIVIDWMKPVTSQQVITSSSDEH